VKKKDDPVQELALAVVQRAVVDAKSGSREKRMDVWWCLKHGALPFWIDLVADGCDGAEAVERELMKLLR
jgi:hypothetical protein